MCYVFCSSSHSYSLSEPRREYRSVSLQRSASHKQKKKKVLKPDSGTPFGDSVLSGNSLLFSVFLFFPVFSFHLSFIFFTCYSLLQASLNNVQQPHLISTQERVIFFPIIHVLTIGNLFKKSIST